MKLFNKKKNNSSKYLVIRNGYHGISAEYRAPRKLKYTSEF